MTFVTSLVMVVRVGCDDMFTCPLCDKEMIWGGDSNDEDTDGVQYVISYHHCNDCNTWLEYGEPMDG